MPEEKTFYFKTKRNGATSYSVYSGMTLDTVLHLMADLGVTEYERIDENQFAAGIKSQNDALPAQ